MSKIYLKIPDKEDENNYFEYIREFKEYSDEKKLSYLVIRNNYKKWLKDIYNLSKKSYKNNDPIILYFLMDDDKLIGHVMIKSKLNFSKKDMIYGNITGAIRPTMRDKGYGKQMLLLALEKCNELNLEDIIINCSIDNEMANKNIKDNGGQLHKILYDPDNNQKYRQYKIKIKK